MEGNFVGDYNTKLRKAGNKGNVKRGGCKEQNENEIDWGILTNMLY